MRFCCSGQPRNIGVIGLGAGTIAAYGRPGDRIHFYEINPAVEPIARNVFTYIRDSGAQVSVIGGDARTSLAQEPPQGFQCAGGGCVFRRCDSVAPADDTGAWRSIESIWLRAASSPSTSRIGMWIWSRRSALLARSAGMQARHRTTGANDQLGEFTATWMLVSDNSDFFAQPEVVAHSARRPQEIPRSAALDR